MALQKPLKRTVRQLTNGTYSNDGHWQYLLHPKFAVDPQHYIRAFLLIQEIYKNSSNMLNLVMKMRIQSPLEYKSF